MGDRTSRGDPGHGEAPDQALQHDGFAAVEVISACRVDDEAVRRVWSHDRRIAEEPHREAFKGLVVGYWLGILHDKSRHQDLCLSDGHAGAQSGGLGRSIRRQHHPPVPVAANQDERRLSRRRRVASLPPKPVCGPVRQEERDDPCHRTPPTRNLHFRPLGRG